MMTTFNEHDRLIPENEESSNSNNENVREAVDEHVKVRSDEKSLSITKKKLENSLKILRSQWSSILLFIILCFIAGISTCTVSIYFPFYPTYAEDKKYLSSSFVGFVMGMISLFVFLFCFLFGIFINVFGVKFLFLSGFIVMTGTFSLMWFHPLMLSTPFAIYSVIFAIMQSYGIAATAIPAYSIGMNLFPQHKNFVISLIDFSTGIGYMIGPALGGELYDHIGYSGTYLVTAILSGVGLITLIFFLPFLRLDSIEKEDYRDYINMFKFLKSGNVLVIVLNNVFVSMSWSILYSTYGRFLVTTYCVSSSIVGYAFAIPNFSYTFSLPVIGYLTDKISSVRIFIFIGLLLLALGLLLIPPAGYIFNDRPDIVYPNLTCPSHGDPSNGLGDSTKFIVISFIGQFILGIGFVLAYNPSFPDLKKHTRLFNLPNMDEKLSALRTASYYLGDGTGPIVSGILINYISFDHLLLIFICIMFILILLIGFSTLVNMNEKRLKKIHLSLKSFLKGIILSLT